MNEALYNHLIASGVDPAVARAAATNVPAEVLEPDALSKALTDLRTEFERERSTDADDQLRKSMAMVETADGARAAISSYADAMIAEQREKDDALFKGMTAIIHAQQSMIGHVTDLLARVEPLAAELEDLRKSLDVPNAPRGVQTSMFDVEPSPSDRAPEPTDDGDTPEVLQKSINAALAAKPDATRRSALIDAAAAVVSGMKPADVRNRYQIPKT